MRSNMLARSAVTFAACAAVGFGVSRSFAVQETVFTAAQADAGKRVYRASCGGCHASDLGGRDDAPALTGPDFLRTWGPRTTRQFLEFVSSTMPPDGAALTPDEYLAVVAHVLQQNGAAAGERALEAGTAVAIASVAPGRP